MEPCPYWDIKEELPKHQNGYCSYLNKSDKELNDKIKSNENEYKPIKRFIFSFLDDFSNYLIKKNYAIKQLMLQNLFYSILDTFFR